MPPKSIAIGIPSFATNALQNPSGNSGIGIEDTSIGRLTLVGSEYFGPTKVGQYLRVADADGTITAGGTLLGAVGATGATGAAGETGLTGAMGGVGATGRVGATGAAGAIGHTGDEGATGLQGLTGFAGAPAPSNVKTLNKAAAPAKFENPITAFCTPPTFIGGAAGYEPTTRLVPRADLYTMYNILLVNASGTLFLDNKIPESLPVCVLYFGVMVGDTFTNTSKLLGEIRVGVASTFYGQEVAWSYELIANRYPGEGAGSLFYKSTGKVTMSVVGASKPATDDFNDNMLSKVSLITQNLEVVNPIPGDGDNLRLSFFITGEGLNPATQTLAVKKYGHIFQCIPA
jgi:hypothetical protein